MVKRMQAQAEEGAGNRPAAVKTLREALDTCRNNRGFSAPVTLAVTERLAQLLAKHPETLTEAEELFQQTYSTRVDLQGVTHPETAHTLSGLVPVLVALNKSEAAHALILKQINSGGGAHLEVLAVPAVMTLVTHFQDEGGLAEAEVLIIEVYSRIK